jgi:hypothetical protein
VEAGHLLLARPRQRRAEGPGRTFVGEHPGVAVTDEGGAPAEGAQNGRSLARMVADEGSELHAQQRGAALLLGLRGHYFLADAPLRWP